jgi:hypothetical protein
MKILGQASTGSGISNVRRVAIPILALQLSLHKELNQNGTFTRSISFTMEYIPIALLS